MLGQRKHDLNGNGDSDAGNESSDESNMDYDVLYEDEEVQGSDDENETETPEQNDNEDSRMKESEAQNRPKSLVQAFANREEIVARYRTQLASLAQSILGYPMRNVFKLKRMIEMLDKPITDPDYGLAFFSIQKLTFLTLNVVFVDLIPNYRVGKRGTITATKLKNQTQQVLEFEHQILQFYQAYILRLKRLISTALELDRGRSNFYRTMLTTAKARERLGLVACRCAGESLVNHFEFNCREDLVELVSMIMCSNRATAEMKQTIFQSLKQLFAKDLLGETTELVVKDLCTRISAGQFRVVPLVFQLFLHLVYKEMNPGNCDQKSLKNESKQREKMSKQERKQAKKMKELERQLLETEAASNRDIRFKCEVACHSQLYAFYMNFLEMVEENLSLTKGDPSDMPRWYRPLFAPVLDGISRLSLQSNEAFAMHAIRRLGQFVSRPYFGTFQAEDKLMFMKTVFGMLRQLGSTDQLDFHDLYRVFYRICFEENTKWWSSARFRTFLECANVMVVKCARHLSFNRLHNFILRFLSMTTELPVPQVIGLLAVVRKTIKSNGALESLLVDDDDEAECNGGDLGVSWAGENPDELSRNRKAVGLFLKLLASNHYDGYVRFYALTMLPGSGNARRANIEKAYQLDREFCQEMLNALDPLQLYDNVLKWYTEFFGKGCQTNLSQSSPLPSNIFCPSSQAIKKHKHVKHKKLKTT